MARTTSTGEPIYEEGDPEVSAARARIAAAGIVAGPDGYTPGQLFDAIRARSWTARTTTPKDLALPGTVVRFEKGRPGTTASIFGHGETMVIALTMALDSALDRESTSP